MPLLKTLTSMRNNFNPQIDDPRPALEQTVQSLTWTDPSRRFPQNPQLRPTGIAQTETPHSLRVDTPRPEVPRRNSARGNILPQIRQIQDQFQRENPGRAPSLSDAELNQFLRDTRPGFAGQKVPPKVPPHNRPQNHRVVQPMAGTRRTVFLDVNRASTQQITPHQVFLKSQVKRQQDATDAWANRTGKPAPPYQFEDFIGKGAYGRVFKAIHKVSQQPFAIKVMDVDAVDSRADAKFRDDSLKEFMHETKVLKKLVGAPNVNQLYDVMEVEAQLWIISEYVPGGSVKALMQGTGGKLDESYILVLAREIAEGLKAIHNVGIIHRDLKAANIMVHEEGRVQIIDFGVSGLVETKTDRRGTVIGTFNWMAPEMLYQAKFPLGDDRQAPDGATYGTEIDVWSYGCTLIEMAKGKPPNAGATSARQMETSLRRMNPRLKTEEGFSQGLSDLVSYVLQLEPSKRPSMHDVLRHPYIYETEKTHPTTTLRELIKVYEDWASSGGQRQSLIQPYGAAPAEFPEDPKSFEDWRFSVVSIGDSAYDNVENAIHLDSAMDPALDLELAQREENNLNSLIPESSYTADASTNHGITMKTTTSEETRIQGVGARFADFFEGAGYSGSEATRPEEPSRPRSDLLLRNDTSESDASQKDGGRKKTIVERRVERRVEQPVDRDARRGTLLQSWDFDKATRPAQEPQQELAQIPSTSTDWNQKDWAANHTFDDFGAPGDDVEVAGHPYAFPGRPALHHYATAPVEPPMIRTSVDTAASRQTLDLDALMNEGTYDHNAPTPSQSYGYNAPPPSQPYGYNAPSSQQYNAPAAYQPYANPVGSAGIIDVQDFNYNVPSPRNDYHNDSVSPTTMTGPADDQSQYATMTGHSITNGSSTYDLTERAHAYYNVPTRAPTDSFNSTTYDNIARPSPPSAAAMASDASAEVMGGELERLALEYQQCLHSAADRWGDESFGEEDADGEDEGGNTYTGLDEN